MGQRFLNENCEGMAIDTFPHWFETLYRSGIYWEFLGWGQLIAVFLLMTQFFSTLGAIAFLPIILNIFFISITYDLGIGLPVITGLLLLVNIFLLLWDYNKLYILLMPDQNRELIIKNQYHYFYNNKFWTYLGLMLFITSLCCVIGFNRDPVKWFFICFALGLIGYIYFVSIIKNSIVKKNSIK